jgi:hypothetical protein
MKNSSKTTLFKLNRISSVSVGVCSFLLLLVGCQEVESTETKYLRQVGDTQYDPMLDNAEFRICHEDLVLQYYNFSSAIQYEGEKYAIEEVFEQQYDVDTILGESGYITIRFIVNCEGKTGWFRVEGVNDQYEIRKFNPEIVSKLLSITKSLAGWKLGVYDKRAYDYYQYLTFKIKDGQLIQIMP